MIYMSTYLSCTQIDRHLTDVCNSSSSSSSKATTTTVVFLLHFHASSFSRFVWSCFYSCMRRCIAALFFLNVLFRQMKNKPRRG